MEELKTISAEEFEKFKVDEDTGVVTIPEGYTLTKERDPKQVIQEEIDRLEAELLNTSEPSNAELIDLGKIYHPYYYLQPQLDYAKEDIKKFDEKPIDPKEPK